MEKELEIAELYQNELKKLKEDKIFKEELFLQKLMELTYDVKKTIDEIDEYRRINKTEALPLDKAFGPYNKCFDIYQFLYDYFFTDEKKMVNELYPKPKIVESQE